MKGLVMNLRKTSEPLKNGRDISIREDGLRLKAVVSIPELTRGVVVLANGPFGDRLNSRNLFLANELNSEGFATVLVDLLNEDESHDQTNLYDVDLLASRLAMVCRWIAQHARLRSLPLGLLGSNASAAAALKASAQLGSCIQAVVSRAGHPDLASDCLDDVQAPTLLIVGSEDTSVLHRNEWILPRLPTEHEIVVIEGADHLFDDEDASMQVADLAAAWLERYLKINDDWKEHSSRVQQAYII